MTQDLPTFHPPQDKRVPVMPFYTFLMRLPFSVIAPHLLRTHTPFDQYRRHIYYICVLQACPLGVRAGETRDKR